MNTSRDNLYLLILRLITPLIALVVLGSMSGCASMFRECLRTESRTVQVCERREANGHCAHYGMKTQTYCAERAQKNSLY